MKGWKTGFTLIELLVVIAIIAVLAAILFPIFVQAKMAATRSKCASNLKQIGTSIMQYCADNQGMFTFSGVHGANNPPSNWDMNYYSKNWSRGACSAFCSIVGPPADLRYNPLQWRWYWPNVLYKYMKDSNIIWCPADPYAWYQRTNLAGWNKWGSYYWRAAVDVAWYGGEGQYNQAGSTCKRDSDYAYPSKQFIIWERWPFHENGGQFPVQNGSRINALYIDGHVACKVIRNCSLPTDFRVDPSVGWYHAASQGGEPFFYNYQPATGRYNSVMEWWDPRQYYDKL